MIQHKQTVCITSLYMCLCVCLRERGSDLILNICTLSHLFPCAIYCIHFLHFVLNWTVSIFNTGIVTNVFVQVLVIYSLSMSGCYSKEILIWRAGSLPPVEEPSTEFKEDTCVGISLWCSSVLALSWGNINDDPSLSLAFRTTSWSIQMTGLSPYLNFNTMISVRRVVQTV